MDDDPIPMPSYTFPCWDLIYKRPEALWMSDLPEYQGMSEVELLAISRRIAPAESMDIMCRLNQMQKDIDLADIRANHSDATEQETKYRLMMKRYGRDFVWYYFHWRE